MVVGAFGRAYFLHKELCRLRRVWSALLVFASLLSGSGWSSAARAQDAAAPAGTQTSSTEKPGLPAAGAESSYEGLTVEDIRFPDLPASINQQELLQLTAQKTGKPLDRDLLRKSIQALYATGRFATIQARGELATSGGVVLSFVTKLNYFVGTVNVEGNLNHPTESQVANAAKLELGELFTQEKLDRAMAAIKRLMEQNGYYKSAVTAQENQHRVSQQVDILLHVDTGPAAHVGEVTVTGNQLYSTPEILDIAGMHPGDRVSAHRVTNALDHMRKKYQKKNRWLAQVRIAKQVYHPESNAVDYNFDIVLGPTVRIETEGFKISRKVLKQNVPVFQENALDDDLLNEGRRNLLSYLQSRGYFKAQVEYRKRRLNQANEMLVTYRINAGDQEKLVKVEIEGNRNFPEDLLRSRMQILPAGRFLSHGHYSQSLLNSDIQTLENDVYRRSGFQQVKINGEIVDNYQGQQDQIALVLHIEEGPQTLVNQLSIEGNHTVSESELPTLNTSPGQPYSETNIADDRDIILNYYFNHGFSNATLEVSANPSPGVADRMDVTYSINEGPQTFVDQVLVTGLEFTHPAVVEREILVQPNEPLSQFRMLRTQQQLYGLGIFSQVDTAVQNPDGDEKKKNVLVDIKEAKRYTFNYGLGFEFQTGQPSVGTSQPQGETGVSPRISFGVTRLNFRGRNHTLSFKANVGRLQQRGLFNYEAPRWFNNPDWKLSFTAFYDNTVDVTTFTSQRLEGSIHAQQVLSKASTMDYHLTYRRVLATNVAVNPNQVPLLSLPVRVGIPGVSYLRDKRDNPLQPTRGNYTTLDVGVASHYFGSQTDFSRVLIQNATYQAFGHNHNVEKKFVFARSTSIGLENPFNHTVYVRPGEPFPDNSPVQPIPLPELFLAGGGNAHRGFGLNQAGPRDPVTGFPIGGSALFLNILELRTPPVTLPFVQDNLSFAIFHDAGNVFITGHDMLHNLLRWSQKRPSLCMDAATADQCDYGYISHAVGVGVRYRTPIGPVRFDFGYNLNPPAFPSCQATASASNPNPSPHCAGQPDTPYFVPQHLGHFNVFFSIGQTF
jgi:outer membrane protein insertion porin family